MIVYNILLSTLCIYLPFVLIIKSSLILAGTYYTMELERLSISNLDLDEDRESSSQARQILVLSCKLVVLILSCVKSV